ncbi:hypothetical protein TNCV_4437151 [Trichonephila clavipes]|nr:hypothetical protein TNCV_4437151 [Trichonephila clavipes]
MKRSIDPWAEQHLCARYEAYQKMVFQLSFKNRHKKVCRLVGQPSVHGRFYYFVVTETLLAKTVFEVPEKVEITRSKVDAAWWMMVDVGCTEKRREIPITEWLS